MTRRSILIQIFLFLVLCVSCRSQPVKLNDGTVEPIYERLLINSTIQKRFDDIDPKQTVFTLDEIFVLSLDKTERLAISAEKNFVADAKIRSAYGAWMPKLSLRSSQYWGAFPGSILPGVRFFARQNIMTGLTEYTGIVGARLSREAEEQSLRAEAAAHFLNLADLALQLELNQTLRDKTAEILKLTERSLGELRRRVALGRSRRSESLRTEAKMKQKQAELLTVTERCAQLARQIQFISGVSGDFSIKVETEPYDVPEGEVEKNFPARADILLGKLIVDIRKNEVEAAFGNHLPQIYLEGSYRPPIIPDSPQSYYGGVVAEIPLFSGMQTVENQNIAKSALRQAELELKQAERKARLELADARAALIQSKAEVAAFEEAVRIAEKNYATQIGEARLSLATNLEVIQSLEDYQTNLVAAENARYRAKLARIRYFIAGGHLFRYKGAD